MWIPYYSICIKQKSNHLRKGFPILSHQALPHDKQKHMLLAPCTNRPPSLHFSLSPCPLPASLFPLPRIFHARGCIPSSWTSLPAAAAGPGEKPPVSAAISPRRRSRAGSAPRTAPPAPGRAPPVPAPSGVQHRGQLHRPAHTPPPLARARPPPPLPPRAGPLLPATHTLHRPFPLASSRLRPSDLNDPPPETPRASRAVSVGREHLWTARPGQLHFLRHVAAFTNKFTWSAHVRLEVTPNPCCLPRFLQFIAGDT